MVETKLIPGFRFYPTDVELVKYFLKRKVLGKKFPFDIIAELDIYKYAPWDLPGKSLLKFGDLEWYFFCPRGKKNASGARMKRATEVGFWKSTGKDRSIEHKNKIVGMIKTLIFHTGRAHRTDWVMHEFRLEDKELTDKGIPQDTYVICKVFQKERLGPRNGAQYGKPFNEEDWDEEEEIDCLESALVAALSAPVPIQHTACHNSVIKEDNTLALNENNRIEEVDNPGQANNAEGTPCFDPSEIFEGLGDLDSLVGLVEDGHAFSCGERVEYTTNEMLSMDDILGFGYPQDFLELIDLEQPLFWRTKHDGNWSQDK